MSRSKVVPIASKRRPKLNASEVRRAMSAVAGEALERVRLSHGDRRTMNDDAFELFNRAQLILGKLGITGSNELMALAMVALVVKSDRPDAWKEAQAELGWTFTPHQARQAWGVVLEIGRALDPGVESAPEVWSRIEACHQALFVLSGDTARRRAALNAIEKAVDRLHGRDEVYSVFTGTLVRAGLPAETLLEILVAQTIDDLAGIEPTFASLPRDKVAIYLRRTRPSYLVQKGGSGNVAPALTAARLSRLVNAFGDAESGEKAVQKRFLEAKRSAKT